MTSLSDLMAQKEALEKRIAETRKSERSDAIQKIRKLMAEYGLTTADLNTKATPRSTSRKGKKVPAKYRDPASGNTWSGRGLQPKWLKAALDSGRKLSDFAL
ncbi:MAG: H-NS histone family protein [Burkholderiaceae bacterium]|jgi:DNA-binding protein H-NS|nr:H-NS histone family protein [Burkholderiaceae bacterium]